MKGHFCPICGAPSLADSAFCSQHRAQAALFSQSFAPPEGAVAAANVMDAPELMPFRALIGDTLAHLMERSKNGELDTSRRVPEMVVYYLRDQLYARVYFSAPPAGAKSGGYLVHSEAVQAVLSHEGLIYQALCTAFAVRMQKLKSGELAAIGLDFLTHADAMGITERKNPDEKATVVRFERAGDTFKLAKRAEQ
jgi:hypothetical protein